MPERMHCGDPRAFIDDLGTTWNLLLALPVAIGIAVKCSVRRWRLRRICAAFPSLASDTLDHEATLGSTSALVDLSYMLKRATRLGVFLSPLACYCGCWWPIAPYSQGCRLWVECRSAMAVVPLGPWHAAATAHLPRHAPCRGVGRPARQGACIFWIRWTRGEPSCYLGASLPRRGCHAPNSDESPLRLAFVALTSGGSSMAPLSMHSGPKLLLQLL